MDVLVLIVAGLLADHDALRILVGHFAQLPALARRIHSSRP